MTGFVIHSSDRDYAGLRDEFCEQLIQASRGEPTSLPFIRNTLPSVSLVRVGEVFQVFVIGGTNGEVATVRADANGNTILVQRAHPELAKFETVEELLNFIDKHVYSTTRVIGINFGFAMTPVVGPSGNLDGIMVGDDTKGHELRGLSGRRVGATIEAYFKAKYGRRLIVSVANDAVCLAALAATGEGDGITLAGILGTGYNLAFGLDASTVVNVQACEFVRRWPVATSRKLYKTEVSGGELYRRYNEMVAELDLPGPIQSCKELATLAENTKTVEGKIAKALFEHSAMLVAAQLSGFYSFTERPARILVVMQGSMFWHVPDYADMVISALDHLGVPPRVFFFRRLQQADTRGIAQIVRGISPLTDNALSRQYLYPETEIA